MSKFLEELKSDIHKIELSRDYRPCEHYGVYDVN